MAAEGEETVDTMLCGPVRPTPSMYIGALGLLAPHVPATTADNAEDTILAGALRPHGSVLYGTADLSIDQSGLDGVGDMELSVSMQETL